MSKTISIEPRQMSLNRGGQRLYPFVKVGRARDPSGDGEHWRLEQLAPTVNLFDMGDARTVVAIVRMDFKK